MSKFVIIAGWDDVPHLSEDQKRDLLNEIPLFQRSARTKGVPALGSGAIYPLEEEAFVIPDRPIPSHWPRAFGFDVGWNRTVALWGAVDRETDVLYVYSEYYRGQAEPEVHAAAMKSRGAWIPGAVDPASRGRMQSDGLQLLTQYRRLGLMLTPADNAVEAGLFAVWQRLSTGRIRVLASCVNFLAEYRMYRRDENGKVVKKFDHLMDALRYLVMSGIGLARLPADYLDKCEFVTRASPVVSEYDPFKEA